MKIKIRNEHDAYDVLKILIRSGYRTSIEKEGLMYELEIADREIVENFLQMDIEELELTVRSFNCLKRADCYCVKDIVKLIENHELHKVRNLGRRSLQEVIDTLKQLGVLENEFYYRIEETENE